MLNICFNTNFIANYSHVQYIIRLLKTIISVEYIQSCNS